MPETSIEILRKRIDDRSATVAVMGLGYVGLPLAVAVAEAGFRVVGIDVDERRVKATSEGTSVINDVPSERLAACIASKRLLATTRSRDLQECDAVLVCVPTPLNKTKEPDVSYIIAALKEIAHFLRRGQLVVLESTTYPGFTAEVGLPLLEESGYRCGVEFNLAFSPERTDPGNAHYNITNTTKVLGGCTPACMMIASRLYETFVSDVHAVSSTDAAEMAKLLENTFRAVNIGLVNEVALMCHTLGIDTWEVIEAASTKPFGFMPFYPGPGLGGHCIPIDPFYLSWKARQYGFEARFIDLAGQVNRTMPHFVVSRIGDVLNERERSIRGARILALGLTYKAGTDDIRESPALDVIDLLQKKGAVVEACDPHVRSEDFDQIGCPLREFSTKTLRDADLVVILTSHPDFDGKTIVKESAEIVDTRNALKGFTSKKIHLL